MPASERISTFWKSATPLKRAAAIAVPAVIAALAIAGITFGAMSMSGGDGNDASAVAPTPSGPTPTPVTPTPSVEDVLRYFAAVLPTATATPEFRGGGTSGGTGGGGSSAPRGGSGPGPILTTDIRLQIPRLGMNTAVNSRTVGTNGQMGDPSGPWMVVWYDFRPFSAGVGGYPGEPGANVVMAGHVDYIRVGPAVFYGLQNLAAGDQITVTGANGPITYAVQWVQWASPSADFTSYVTHQGQETITLVTCVGSFSAGHYSNRLVVRGVRI
jgi:LPXTG-site transpeptidase (sortase) family protein